MKVLKKLNNNVVIALNEKGEEVIISGKGLGFQKTPYELQDESVIEKMYVMPDKNQAESILSSMPSDIIAVTEKIISFGTDILEKKLNPSMFLSLCDHINYAAQRCREGMELKSPLYWEIKNIYPEEYKIGMESVKIINENLQINMDNSEAAFIALHFINGQNDSGDMRQTTKVATIIGEILDIVKYHFKMEFDEDSFNLRRFVTHIKYFILRQIDGEHTDNSNEFMFDIMKKKCPDEYDCVKKIEKYLLANYNWKCSKDEQLYLIMHIQRLTSRQNNK